MQKIDSFRRIAQATTVFFKQALAIEINYRFSLIQQAIGSVIAFTGLVYFWRAASINAVTQTNYTVATLTCYLLIAATQPMLQDSKVSTSISTAIRMGKLSSYLLRPYPYLMGIGAQAYAVAFLRALILFPLIGLAVYCIDYFSVMSQKLTLNNVCFFSLATLLGVTICLFARIIVGLLAFDMTQTWGPELVFLAFYTMLGGEAFPLDLLPEPWFLIATWTPAFYMIGFPALVLIGRIPTEEFWNLFARGSLVAFITGLIVYWMWRRGLKRFEAVGI